MFVNLLSSLQNKNPYIRMLVVTYFVLSLSRTDSNDDVDDATRFSALDVISWNKVNLVSSCSSGFMPFISFLVVSMSCSSLSKLSAGDGLLLLLSTVYFLRRVTYDSRRTMHDASSSRLARGTQYQAIVKLNCLQGQARVLVKLWCPRKESL